MCAPPQRGESPRGHQERWVVRRDWITPAGQGELGFAQMSPTGEHVSGHEEQESDGRGGADATSGVFIVEAFVLSTGELTEQKPCPSGLRFPHAILVQDRASLPTESQQGNWDRRSQALHLTIRAYRTSEPKSFDFGPSHSLRTCANKIKRSRAKNEIRAGRQRVVLVVS
jgi:hypothetical protein